MNILYDERLDGPLPQVGKDGLLAELRLRLSDLELLYTTEDLRPYECDGLSAYRYTPLSMAPPERIEQVRDLLAFCHWLKMPVVARSADTGLSGGALPLKNGVLLAMACFRRVLEIDPPSRFTRVQPGVHNLAISQAAAPHGLYYTPDPSSQTACSIGGNVTENADGVHYPKYDLTAHNLLQIGIVTLRGECLSLGSSALDSAGFGLLALSTDSEGLLDVVVEVTVRPLPRPPVAKVLLTSFDSVESVGRAMADLISADIVPAGLEIMGNLSIRVAKDFIRADCPVGAAAALLCELDGTEASVHEDCERVRELFEAASSTSVRQTRDEAERQRFWTGRESAFPAVGRISPDYYCMDGSIPRRELPRVLHDIAELSREYGLRVANVFHTGDGNMHPLVLFGTNLPGGLERTEALGDRVFEPCAAMGDGITGEHGIGREKINQVYAQFNADELALFHAVKTAFNPAGLLSPGKNVPTLHRCVEFGAMHVHHGRLPSPELEHF